MDTRRSHSIQTISPGRDLTMPHPPLGHPSMYGAHSRCGQLLVLLLLSLVAACGGGGEDDAAVAPTATPTVIATATPFAVAPEPTIITGADAPPAPRGEVTYLVEAGDTLSAIAERFETTVGAIMEANDLTDPTLIFSGQELTIPDETGAALTPNVGGAESNGGAAGVTRYVVQAGDTAYDIALQFGVTLAELAQANDTTVEALSSLNVGDDLALPRPP